MPAIKRAHYSVRFPELPAEHPYVRAAVYFGVTPENGEFVTNVPSRDDKTPSFVVTYQPDRVLFKDRTGQTTTEDNVAAMGWTMADLFLKRATATTGVYPYHDTAGKLLYEVHRIEPGREGRKKDFLQRHQCKDETWTWGLGGDASKCACKKKPKVLYRLPELRKAIAASRKVFVVEGERKADALRALGLTGTTSPGGASNWKFDYASSLEDAAQVCIIADNDEAGRNYANAVGRSLTGKVKDLRVIYALPGSKDKDDVIDWLARGGTRADLEKLSIAAPVWVDRVGAEEAVQPYDEEGLANIFYKEVGAPLDSLVLNGKSSGDFYSYTDRGVFVPNGMPEADALLRTLLWPVLEARRAKAIDLSEREKLDEALHFARSITGRRFTLTAFQSLPGIRVEDGDFERRRDLICTPENVIRPTAEGLEKTPHSPSYRQLNQTRAHYKPGAVAPRFLAFIEQAYGGDKEMVLFEQKLAGSLLLGGNREKRLWVRLGPNDTGKTTINELYAYVLGDYAGAAPRDLFRERRNDKHSAVDDAVRGKRLLTQGEIPKGVHLSAALIKEHTGGDSIASRAMNQNYSANTEPCHKVLFSWNDMPDIEAGAMHRIRVIPWIRVFGGQSQDTDLLNKLKEEASGILNWMLEGAVLYLRDKRLDCPAKVRQATARFARDVNPVAMYASEVIRKEPGRKTLWASVEISFRTWLERRPNSRRVGPAELRKELEKLGYTSRKGRGPGGEEGVMIFFDIGLVDYKAQIPMLSHELDALTLTENKDSIYPEFK